LLIAYFTGDQLWSKNSISGPPKKRGSKQENDL